MHRDSRPISQTLRLPFSPSPLPHLVSPFYFAFFFIFIPPSFLYLSCPSRQRNDNVTRMNSKHSSQRRRSCNIESRKCYENKVRMIERFQCLSLRQLWIIPHAVLILFFTIFSTKSLGFGSQVVQLNPTRNFLSGLSPSTLNKIPCFLWLFSRSSTINWFRKIANAIYRDWFNPQISWIYSLDVCVSKTHFYQVKA